MFGSLFDDERPAGVMTNVHTLAIPRPPNRRLLCGLSGIENQGATCYLNSLLQTLLYTPEFRGTCKLGILLRNLIFTDHHKCRLSEFQGKGRAYNVYKHYL